jgi:hypothetical protein
MAPVSVPLTAPGAGAVVVVALPPLLVLEEQAVKANANPRPMTVFRLHRWPGSFLMTCSFRFASMCSQRVTLSWSIDVR